MEETQFLSYDLSALVWDWDVTPGDTQVKGLEAFLYVLFQTSPESVITSK